MKHSIAALATWLAIALLDELPPTDELTYNQRLAILWEWIMLDLIREIFEYGRYGLNLWSADEEEAYVQLMSEEPIDAAAVEAFLRDLLGPKWLQKGLKHALHHCMPQWRDGLRPQAEQAS